MDKLLTSYEIDKNKLRSQKSAEMNDLEAKRKR